MFFYLAKVVWFVLQPSTLIALLIGYGAILIWTRAFGIFGPLMVFVGAVRKRTEVLPTTVYLEQSVGRIEVALAVAVLMLLLVGTALLTVRLIGLRD